MFTTRNDITLSCVTYLGSSSIVGPFQNTAEESSANQIRQKNAVATPFENSGDRSIPDCNPDGTVQISADVTPYGYGVFRAITNVTHVTCDEWTWTSPPGDPYSAPSPTIHSCDAPVTTTNTKYTTVWCGGAIVNTDYADYNVPGWDATACNNQNDSTPLWTCKPGTPQIDGKNIDHQNTLDDDKVHSMTWAGSKFVGQKSGSLTNKQSRIYVDTDSTPWNGATTNANANSSTQPFVVKPGADVWQSGWLSEWNVDFMAASDAGAPWTAFQQYQADGLFPTKDITVTSVDGNSGDMTTTTTTDYLAEHGSCDSDPVKFSIYRVRSN